jgi:hypothetical protein
VQLHHSEMPEVASWEGIHAPKAKLKPPRRGASHRRPTTAVETAKSGQCRCPIRGSGRAPAGWNYNCSLWAPLIDTYLSPWAEGNVSATVLDMAFWRMLYGEARSHALPGVHFSSRGGMLRIKENVDYRMPLFTDMMRSVNRLVRLPDVEFVAHLWDHPKVDRQTPLPVFAHYADVSHRDVPMPAPWSWDEKLHAFPQPWVKLNPSMCSSPWARRTPSLYFRGGCNGPTRGWRGPLWKFYPRKRANRISKAVPGVDAGVFDHCDSPKLTKLEWGWDAQMENEMRASGTKKPIEPFGANCRYRCVDRV